MRVFMLSNGIVQSASYRYRLARQVASSGDFDWKRNQQGPQEKASEDLQTVINPAPAPTANVSLDANFFAAPAVAGLNRRARSCKALKEEKRTMLFAPCFMICSHRVAGSEIGPDINMDIVEMQRSAKAERVGSSAM